MLDTAGGGEMRGKLHLHVCVDALAGALAAQAGRADPEGRLRFVAERAQHVCQAQAARPDAQVPALQSAAHAPVVQDAVAHLHAHGRALMSMLTAFQQQCPRKDLPLADLLSRAGLGFRSR